MSLVSDTLRSLVSKMEVRTTAGNIVLDDPFGEPGPPSVANRILRPSLYVYDSGGNVIYHNALYGEPPVNLGPTLVFGGALLSAWFFYRAFLR